MSALVFSFDAFRSDVKRDRNPVAALPFAERRARNIADNFYPTPPEATRALLSVEDFDGPVWEPACGEGHIAQVLKAAGLDVVATDLNDRGYGTVDVDFLMQRAMRGKHIVTNPPYGLGMADAFIEKSLEFARETGGKVAMIGEVLCANRVFRWLNTGSCAAIDDVIAIQNTMLSVDLPLTR